jgi:hypothetical protein
MSKRQFLLFLAGLIIISAAVTTLDVSLAAAVEHELLSARVEGDLPLADPAAALWDDATAVDVPLSGQAVLAPMNPDASVSSMRVRSVNNGAWIAFLLEWEDPSKDVGGGVLDFKDSAAIQFPSHEGEPFACMGQSGGTVEILNWRADFQQDIETGLPNAKDIYPNMWTSIYPGDDSPQTFLTGQGAGNPMSLADRTTPVEDLVAGGAGTLTSQAHNDAVGWAEWNDGTWKAVIGRPMTTVDDEDAQFEGGLETSVALAAWDGGRDEVNGKKSVSTWLTLKIGGAPIGATASGVEDDGLPEFNMAVFILTVFGLVILGIAASGTTYALARRRNNA